MDENKVLLSVSLLTENTKMIMSDITKVQDDVSKIENDVSILKKSSVSSSSGGGVSSGTNANLIADGSVSNTEFQYLSGVTSAIQSQLDGKLGLTAGTTTDHQKLVMYNNAGGGADPSFAFAAIKDTTTSIDSNRTFRVNSGSHTNNRDFTVNTVGEVEAASFTASSQVSITGTGAGGDDVGNTPAAVALRCLGGMTIGPAGALSATPEKICLNGVIGLGSTATGVSYGTQGQVLTSQGSAALPTWTTVSSGGGSTAVYMAADASVASVSDGFITYLSSPIVENCTFNNDAFSPDRAGDYKVTSNLTFTGGSATVRIGKSLTQLSNNILTAALSYDFRTASNTYTTPDLNLFLNDDSASLILDSGSATINTSDGYQGGTSHYIDLTSFPTGSKLPPNFAFELVLKLNSPSGQPSTSNQPIFVVHKNVRQLEEHMIRLFRYGTTSDLRLQFNNSVDSVGVTLSDHHIAFNNNHQEFEHLFIQFTSNGCTVYRNGVQATATQSTSNPNNNQATLTTSNGTAINVTKVTLGRYLDRNGSGSSDQDNGIEHIKFFRYYTQSATADQVRSLYEQHALQLDVLGKSSGSGTVITQAIAQQLATTDSIKVHAEGSFTGYSGDAALIVEHIDGGSQGTPGTNYGGQKAHGCATFTSFADKIYIEEEGSSSLNNGLLLYNASNTNYSHNGTTVTVHGHSNYPCIGPSWTTTSPTVLDDHTTTLYGMTERYTSVGVTLINSAMNNGAPTQWRGNDRLDSHAQGNTNTPPTRWRILTTGEYHVKATIAIGDSTPNGGNWTQAWIFVRTGQLNPNDGSYENTTTVRVAAYQKLLPAGGGSGLDERVLQFDEALRLNQHDEVYIGMSHGFSTGTEPNDNYYMGNVQTTFSIEQVLGQGPQGPAGVGVPTGGTNGQVLTSSGYGNPLKWTTPNALSAGASNPVYYEATLQNGRITSVTVQSGATDAGRTANTYEVSGTTSGSGSEHVLRVTVDANGTVSNSGLTIVNSGKNFTTSDTISIDLGGIADLVLSVQTVTDLKIQCSSEPGFVNLTSWHVPANSMIVSHQSAFAFNNSKRIFEAPRNGRYLVHMRTALKETTTSERMLQMTQRLFKVIALTPNSVYDATVHASIPTATYSLDFRKVQSVSTNANIQFPTFSNPANTQASDNPNNTEVQIVKESSATFPTFSSTDGYPGSTSHFIRMGVLNATQPVELASGTTADFSLEFVAKPFSTNFSYLFSAKLSSTNTLMHVIISNSLIWVNATNSSGTYVTEMFYRSISSAFLHIVITYTPGSFKLYLDNDPGNSVSFTMSTSAPLETRLGRSWAGNDPGVEHIRFFRFYNSELSAAQVSTLYFAHVQNDAREYITTYHANKAALYGSVGSTNQSQFMSSSSDQSPLSTTFQFDKLVYLDANDVLAIEQNTDNRGISNGVADNALEFIPDETALIVRSVD